MKALVWIIATMAVVGSGCIGPGAYIYTTSYKARRVVAEATEISAKTFAPYEYWSAVVYLEMSRQKAAQADFEDAWKYGKKAAKMGDLAKRITTRQVKSNPYAIYTLIKERHTPPTYPSSKGKQIK